MPTGDEAKGALMGLSGINVAVNGGLTNTQIANATGVSNLQDTIRALSLLPGTAPMAFEQAARALGFAKNAGVVTDSIVQGWTTAATARATFTAYNPGVNDNTIEYLPN